MTYQVETTIHFDKQIKKMDRFVAITILKWLEKKVNNSENPRIYGKQLKGNLSNYWRYRVGDYRIICEINDDTLIVLAIEAGHRRKISNILNQCNY
ncbi:type II toxin-antitoxin system RelE/ParE family toxin [Aerococcaceae bacterium DSM 111021]|nr:type II toxin-antitoxin system RelE/ParE family toxin [Aerococcaceae bacterium DSM 111021]